MPSLNYKARFADQVWHGQKRQTIRAQRKVPIKVGDTLYHFTGMRTKECKRIRVSLCKSAYAIAIWRGTVSVDYDPLSYCEINALARADGFDSTEEFFKFFCTPLCPIFRGQLIKW